MTKVLRLTNGKIIEVFFTEGSRGPATFTVTAEREKVACWTLEGGFVPVEGSTFSRWETEAIVEECFRLFKKYRAQHFLKRELGLLRDYGVTAIPHSYENLKDHFKRDRSFSESIIEVDSKKLPHPDFEDVSASQIMVIRGAESRTLHDIEWILKVWLKAKHQPYLLFCYDSESDILSQPSITSLVEAGHHSGRGARILVKDGNQGYVPLTVPARAE